MVTDGVLLQQDQQVQQAGGVSIFLDKEVVFNFHD